MRQSIQSTFGWTLFKYPAALIVIALLQAPAKADITSLGLEWGEGMVLQSGIAAPLNGSAKAGDKVTITFRSRTYNGLADNSGKWKVEVDPGAAGGPFAMTIQGGTTIEFNKVHVADLKLAGILGDGMVLQRGDKAPAFGTTVPKEKVTVTFRGKKFETVADAKGVWRLDVVPGEAGGPFVMTIAGQATLVLKEVYVGDVWV